MTLTRVACLPPDVEWQLKAHNEDTLVYLPRSVSEGMLACAS